MVVGLLRRLPAAALLWAFLLLAPSTALAQEAPRPEERTRVGIAAQVREEAEPANLGRITASASNILVQRHPEALFVNAPTDRFLTEGEPDLAAADEALLDLFLLITLGARTEEDGHSVTLSLYDVRAAELLGSLESTVSIDRLGRYLRSSSWEDAVAELAPFIEAYRPFTEVVILTEPGARLTWGDSGGAEASEAGRATVPLRNMRSYRITAELDGYRTDSTTVFVERERMEVDLDLLRYPRWMVELSFAGLSFPRIGGGRFLRETSLYLYGEFTTRSIGFTPFIQMNRQEDEEDPRLFSSYPVSEVALGADLYLRNRNSLLRPSVGVQLLGRFLHAGYISGLDPVLPVGAAVRIGAQYELGEHFFLFSNLDSRFYYLREAPFLAPYDFTYRLGNLPTLWQPVTLTFGGRYAP
ncbi:MAG: hypothetical protein ACOC47_01965 [Alkalispirochaetaceae bacterium]